VDDGGECGEDASEVREIGEAVRQFVRTYLFSPCEVAKTVALLCTRGRIAHIDSPREQPFPDRKPL
jgi:hypothetical protein